MPASAQEPPFWTDAVARAQASHRSRFEALYAQDSGGGTAAICGPMFGASHGLRGTSAIDMLTQPDEWVADGLADMTAKAGTLADPVAFAPAHFEIGINLFGQRLPEALLVAPEDARRALRTITDVILGCLRAFRRAVPPDLLRTTCAGSRYAPAGYGFIDGCAAQLVSAEVYRGFFAPLDAEILSAWPHGGMIHLCGACAQHIPAWREMPALRSVQLNDRATDDLELYVAGLRPDQILYLSPTATYPPARILNLTRGRRLVMQWRPSAKTTGSP